MTIHPLPNAVALAIRMLEGVHEVKEGYPLGG